MIGPVSTCLPVGTPEWVTRGRSFERRSFHDCAALVTGMTGNCLISLRLVSAARLDLDRALGVLGGEYHARFWRVHLSSGRLVTAIQPAERGHDATVAAWLVGIHNTISRADFILKEPATCDAQRRERRGAATQAATGLFGYRDYE